VTSHKWHIERATDFVERMGGELLENGGGFTDLMVITENVLVSIMMINTRIFDLKPHIAAGLMEEALQRAIERFTADIRRDRA
jgi:hypothetical protein